MLKTSIVTGEQLRDIKGKKGFPLGQEMIQKAADGKISEVTSRPRTDKPLEKTYTDL
jgi:hypothetical protein